MNLSTLLTRSVGTILLASSVAVLTACGGGSSSTSLTTPAEVADLKFTQAEFENAVYISSDMFDKTATDFEEAGGVIKFAAGTAQYYDRPNSTQAQETATAWEVLPSGELQMTFGTTTCVFKKVKEDASSVETTGTCGGGESVGTAKWLKPQMIKVSDLEGRTIVVSGPKRDNPDILEDKVRLAFKADGTVMVIVGKRDEQPFTYNMASDKSLVVNFEANGVARPQIYYLAEGTIASGKLLHVSTEGAGKLRGLSVLTTNGDKWVESNFYSVPTENGTK